MACYDWRILEKLQTIIDRIGTYRVDIRAYCAKEGIFHQLDGQRMITLDDLQEVAYLFDVDTCVYAL